MNRSKRQLFISLTMLPIRNTETVSQVTRYNKTCEIGSLHLIHGKITTSLKNLTLGPPPGSSSATPSRSGSSLVQAPSYGFTENLGISNPYAFAGADIALIPFAFVAGARKTVLWWVNISKLSLRVLMCANVQLNNHRGHHHHA